MAGAPRRPGSHPDSRELTMKAGVVSHLTQPEIPEAEPEPPKRGLSAFPPYLA
jgi:hypothetical protein